MSTNKELMFFPSVEDSIVNNKSKLINSKTKNVICRYKDIIFFDTVEITDSIADRLHNLKVKIDLILKGETTND